MTKLLIEQPYWNLSINAAFFFVNNKKHSVPHPGTTELPAQSLEGEQALCGILNTEDGFPSPPLPL